MRNKNLKNLIKKQSVEIDNSTTLYELNKQMIEQCEEELVGETKVRIANENILPLLNSTNNNHYMLLGRDLNYYTIFESKSDTDFDYNNLIEEVLDCLTYVGKVFAIYYLPLQDDEEKKNENAVEIWVKTWETQKMHCLYLFPYDTGVVKY